MFLVKTVVLASLTIKNKYCSLQLKSDSVIVFVWSQ